ncbi:diguanylate cyclase [Vibrio ponticus]|nr:diguanylate cyclase [Vibrio ponticus]
MPPQQLQHWFQQITAKGPFFSAIIDSQHNYVMVNDAIAISLG